MLAYFHLGLLVLKKLQYGLEKLTTTIIFISESNPGGYHEYNLELLEIVK